MRSLSRAGEGQGEGRALPAEPATGAITAIGRPSPRRPPAARPSPTREREGCVSRCTEARWRKGGGNYGDSAFISSCPGAVCSHLRHAEEPASAGVSKHAGKHPQPSCVLQDAPSALLSMTPWRAAPPLGAARLPLPSGRGSSAEGAGRRRPGTRAAKRAGLVAEGEGRAPPAEPAPSATTATGRPSPGSGCRPSPPSPARERGGRCQPLLR